MKLTKITKKQMGKEPKGTPQLYTCQVEFTEAELESFIDNVVVETKPGVAEDLTSFVMGKIYSSMTTSPLYTTTKVEDTELYKITIGTGTAPYTTDDFITTVKV